MDINELKSIIQKSLEVAEIPDDLSADTCDSWDSLGHLRILVNIESYCQEKGVSIELDLSESLSFEDLRNKLQQSGILQT